MSATLQRVDVPCPRCDGVGYADAFAHRDGGLCYSCHGTGRIAVPASKAAAYLPQPAPEPTYPDYPSYPALPKGERLTREQWETLNRLTDGDRDLAEQYLTEAGVAWPVPRPFDVYIHRDLMQAAIDLALDRFQGESRTLRDETFDEDWGRPDDADDWEDGL